MTADKETIFTIHVIPNVESMDAFLNWQKRFNKIVAAFSGFLSLEITVSPENQHEWIIRERFKNVHALRDWQQSAECLSLLAELHLYAHEKNIRNEETHIQGITEVIVTEVMPGKEQEFRAWMARIHEVEAKFPGFRGAYVQAPHSEKSRNWITLLQFDTAEHLNNWLSSKERASILKESEPLITSLENHRVASPFAGWFQGEESAAAWKQGMIVLLVLYPIVMLEMFFLNPLLEGMDLAPKVFIGNSISVALVTLLMPAAVWCLAWWLTPAKSRWITTAGVALLAVLYLLEVLIFILSRDIIAP